MEEALRLVLERVRPLAAERGRWTRLGARAGRARSRRSTCRRSTARRWTASPCARRTRRANCRSCFGSRPVGPRRVDSVGQAMGIATGAYAVRPTGADAVIPSSMLSTVTTPWQSISVSSLVHPCAPVGATSWRRCRRRRRAARAGSTGRAGSCRRGGGRVRAARAPPSDDGLRAPLAESSSSQGKSTRPTASSSRRSWRAREPTSTGSRRPPTAARAPRRARAGLEADVLVSTGGVSVGPRPRPVGRRLGIEVF